MSQNRQHELLSVFAQIYPHSAEHVQRVFDRFFHRSIQRGTASRFEEALQKGEQRDPVTHQVIMHYNSPMMSEQWLFSRIDNSYGVERFSAEDVYSSITEYRSRLQGLMNESVIHIESAYDYSSLCRPKCAVRRCASLPSYGTDTGYLAEEEMLRFLDFTTGIHKNDTFILHGAYVGACIDHFALQITALKLFHQYHVANVANDDGLSCLTEDEESAMELFDRTLELPKLAKIQYGIAYDVYNLRAHPGAKQFINAMMGPMSHILPIDHSRGAQ